MALRAATRTDSRLSARLAAIASLGAAVIHFAVAPTHWQHWTASGLFFVSLGLFQLIWARLVLSRTTRPVLGAGIVANVGAVALWGLSRTAGAPLGPNAGQPEIVQAADLCALLLEVYVVMGAGWLWYRGRRSGSLPAFANRSVLLGGSAVIVLASTVGAASGLQHGHDAPSVGHAGGHHDHPAPAAPRLVIVEATGTPAIPASDEPAPPGAEPLHGHTDGNHYHQHE